MQRSAARSTPTLRWWLAFAKRWLAKGSTRCLPARSAKRRRLSRSSMASAKPSSSPWPAPSRRPAVLAGRSASWPNTSSNAKSLRAPTSIRSPGAKKNDIKPHLKEYWVIPPKANAAFVAAMEDVLEVYTRPHDPAQPLVCLDETSLCRARHRDVYADHRTMPNGLLKTPTFGTIASRRADSIRHSGSHSASKKASRWSFGWKRVLLRRLYGLSFASAASLSAR